MAKILVFLFSLPCAIFFALIGAGLIQKASHIPNWAAFGAAIFMLYILYKGALS